MKNHELDDKLVEWSEARETDDASMSELTRRVIAATRQLPRPLEESCRRIRPGLDRCLWFVAGAAACLLLVAALSHEKAPVADPSTSVSPIASTSAPPVDWEPIHRVYEEMARMFPDRVRWVADSGAQLDFELKERHGTSGTPPVGVHFLLLRRSVGETEWGAAWEGTILSDSEETVVCRAEDAVVRKLTLWTYLLPDGMIAVDVTLELHPSKWTITSSLLANSGETKDIFRMKTSDMEFRLVQTATTIPVS
ncbi:MAG: hypothetical protein KAI66_06800 [Lentisphaeria bacterium]|nr:hypothetical protein [Lentisphaeria bacterium]